jgi:hypothetical protein
MMRGEKLSIGNYGLSIASWLCSTHDINSESRAKEEKQTNKIEMPLYPSIHP